MAKGGKPDWAKVIRIKERYRELGKTKRYITITKVDWDTHKIYFFYEEKPEDGEFFNLACYFYEWFEKVK